MGDSKLPRLNRFVVAVMLGGFLMPASGCIEDRGLVPVSGVVTLAGSSMPDEGSVRFLPVSVEEGFPTRPAHARFKADGAYEAQTFEPGDGLYPGTYRVVVECWEIPHTMGGPPAKSFLHARYSNAKQSGLEITVPSDADPVTFDIKVEPRK